MPFENQFFLTMLGTDVTKAQAKPDKATYPKGELLNQLYLAHKGQETQDKAIIDGPYTSGSNVGELIAEGTLKVLKALEQGKTDIKMQGFSRGACCSLLVAHELQRIREILNTPNLTKEIFFQKLIDETPCKSYTKPGLTKRAAEIRKLDFEKLKTSLEAHQIDLYLVDPVPGIGAYLPESLDYFAWVDSRFEKLPANVKHAEQLMQKHENTKSFRTFLPTANENQSFRTHLLYGFHGTVTGTKATLTENQISNIAMAKIIDFFGIDLFNPKDEKDSFQMDIRQYCTPSDSSISPELHRKKQKLEFYRQAQKNKPEYKKLALTSQYSLPMEDPKKGGKQNKLRSKRIVKMGAKETAYNVMPELGPRIHQFVNLDHFALHWEMEYGIDINKMGSEKQLISKLIALLNNLYQKNDKSKYEVVKRIIANKDVYQTQLTSLIEAALHEIFKEKMDNPKLPIHTRTDEFIASITKVEKDIEQMAFLSEEEKKLLAEEEKKPEKERKFTLATLLRITTSDKENLKKVFHDSIENAKRQNTLKMHQHFMDKLTDFPKISEEKPLTEVDIANIINTFTHLGRMHDAINEFGDAKCVDVQLNMHLLSIEGGVSKYRESIRQHQESFHYFYNKYISDSDDEGMSQPDKQNQELFQTAKHNFQYFRMKSGLDQVITSIQLTRVLQKDIKTLEKENKALNEVILQKSENNQRKQQEISLQALQLDSNNGQIKQLTGQLAQMNASLLQRNHEIDANKNEIRGLNERMTGLEKVIAEKTQDSNQKASEIKEKNKLLEEKDSQIKAAHESFGYQFDVLEKGLKYDFGGKHKQEFQVAIRKFYDLVVEYKEKSPKKNLTPLLNVVNACLFKPSEDNFKALKKLIREPVISQEILKILKEKKEILQNIFYYCSPTHTRLFRDHFEKSDKVDLLISKILGKEDFWHSRAFAVNEPKGVSEMVGVDKTDANYLAEIKEIAKNRASHGFFTRMGRAKATNEFYDILKQADSNIETEDALVKFLEKIG